MKLFQWQCAGCGFEQESERPQPCKVCGGPVQRVYTVRFNRRSANTEEVWNPSLGIAHRTDTQAAEHLKKLNDTEGTHYVMTDPEDTRIM